MSSATRKNGGRREDVAAVHVDQPRQADGDGGPVPLRAVRLALVRRPALHHQLPGLRRPGRRDHPLHLPPRPRVVLASRSRSRPRSRCSSATTLSLMAQYRAGPFIPPALTQLLPKRLPAAGM